MNHSINISEAATSVSTPIVAESGIPYVIGTAPVQSAPNPANPLMPVLCTSWEEAVETLGYSDDWKSYTLCEFMYSHFKLFGCQPVIFCNVLDISKMKESVDAADISITNHKIKLPLEAIRDETLVVKAEGGESDYMLEKDYSVYTDGENLVIEFLQDGGAYSVSKANVAYSKVTPASVAVSDIAAGIENIEMCLTKIGIIPDIICAPGFSDKPEVAAAMAAKADNVNGLFRAISLIDVDTGNSGVKKYSDVLEYKNQKNLTDKNMIVCWPMVSNGGRIYHLSTQLAGAISQVDSNNDGCPYESPSNKNLQCDGLVLSDGSEVNLTLAQANILNAIGITTALNFVNGWVAWGNYTACYPENTDVKDFLLPINRMFGWVGSTLIKTFWAKLDKPMNRRLLDTILDTANIWLNGLVGREYLLGARVEMIDGENPEANLMQGLIKLHIYLTPPSPAQEIDFVLEYDVNYLTSALES